MRLVMLQVIVIVGLGLSAGAAEQTWAGKVSDSLCGLTHEAMALGAGLSDHDCTVECVKAGGKYVFVVGDNVYQIANQDLPGLAEHAAQPVTLTGELKGDTITVSSIEPAPGSH